MGTFSWLFYLRQEEAGIREHRQGEVSHLGADAGGVLWVHGQPALQSEILSHKTRTKPTKQRRTTLKNNNNKCLKTSLKTKNSEC